MPNLDPRLKDYPETWLDLVSSDHKIRVRKKNSHWFLFLPTDQPGKRVAVRFDTAEAAFTAAIIIQDGINRRAQSNG
jgi:hypothetical protein